MRPILVDLMKNELQILEGISHPNIMRVYELLHDEKYYYIVSEYIQDGHLYDLVQKRPLSVKGALTESEVKLIVK